MGREPRLGPDSAPCQRPLRDLGLSPCEGVAEAWRGRSLFGARFQACPWPLNRGPLEAPPVGGEARQQVPPTPGHLAAALSVTGCV